MSKNEEVKLKNFKAKCTRDRQGKRRCVIVRVKKTKKQIELEKKIKSLRQQLKVQKPSEINPDIRAQRLRYFQMLDKIEQKKKVDTKSIPIDILKKLIDKAEKKQTKDVSTETMFRATKAKKPEKSKEVKKTPKSPRPKPEEKVEVGEDTTFEDDIDEMDKVIMKLDETDRVADLREIYDGLYAEWLAIQEGEVSKSALKGIVNSFFILKKMIVEEIIKQDKIPAKLFLLPYAKPTEIAIKEKKGEGKNQTSNIIEEVLRESGHEWGISGSEAIKYWADREDVQFDHEPGDVDYLINTNKENLYELFNDIRKKSKLQIPPILKRQASRSYNIDKNDILIPEAMRGLKVDFNEVTNNYLNPKQLLHIYEQALEEEEIFDNEATNKKINALKEIIGKQGGGEEEGGIYDSDINEMMKNSPNYLGTISCDNIKDLKPSKNCSFIYNTDTSDGPGIHWVAVRVDDDSKSLEHFDPLGDHPNDVANKGLKSLMEKVNSPYMYKYKINTVKNQRDDTDTCGYQCVRFLKDREKGISFVKATHYEEPKQQDETEIGEAKANIIKNKFDYI